MPLFAEYYKQKGFTGSDVVVVSLKTQVLNARSPAEYLDAPIAIIDYAPRMIQNVKKATSLVRLKEKKQSWLMISSILVKTYC